MTDTPTIQPRKLTLSEVRESARKIADENPDTTVEPEQCHYQNSDGSPSCLVGFVFHDLDRPFFDSLATLRLDLMDEEQAVANSVPVQYLVEGLELEDEWGDGVQKYLNDLQESQDGGMTWRAAFGRAERLVVVPPRKQIQTLNGDTK